MAIGHFPLGRRSRGEGDWVRKLNHASHQIPDFQIPDYSEIIPPNNPTTQ
jgi:hypothetical protein